MSLHMNYNSIGETYYIHKRRNVGETNGKSSCQRLSTNAFNASSVLYLSLKFNWKESR